MADEHGDPELERVVLASLGLAPWGAHEQAAQTATAKMEALRQASVADARLRQAQHAEFRASLARDQEQDALKRGVETLKQAQADRERAAALVESDRNQRLDAANAEPQARRRAVLASCEARLVSQQSKK